MPKNRSIRSQTNSPLYFEHSDIFSQSLIKTLQFVGQKHERKNLVNLWLEPGFEQLLFAVSGIAEKKNFCGLWFGSSKPDFRTFLEPFGSTLKDMFHKGKP